MDTLFNFGIPSKDTNSLAQEILGDHKKLVIPITGITAYAGRGKQITSPCYGVELTWDTLSMMKEMELINQNDKIVFLGSMGSLNKKIKTMDMVVPVEAVSDYLEQVFHAKNAVPDSFLLSKLEKILNEKGGYYVKYKHGSDAGVFDPRLNHLNYKHEVFGKDILGVDCGEVFIGMHFCNRNKIKSVALLYCSDDPNAKIKEIPREEFNRRAVERDMLINKIGYELLNSK